MGKAISSTRNCFKGTASRTLQLKRCTSRRKLASLYTGRPISVDTHRSYLAEAKTFLSWCVEKRRLRVHPLAGVRGFGRRKHGKEQLTIDEARRWLAHALELIPTEPGALAAALLLLCGLRSSEVVESSSLIPNIKKPA